MTPAREDPLDVTALTRRIANKIGIPPVEALQEGSRRLASMALHPVILNSVSFAESVLAELSSRHLMRSDFRSLVMGRVHYRMALEAMETGFAPAARRYMANAIMFQPATAARPTTWRCLRAPRGGALSAAETIPVFNSLAAANIDWCVVGSAAINIHAGRTVKTARDLDINFGSTTDLHQALDILDRLGFTTQEGRVWTSEQNQNQLVNMRSRSGMLVELGYLPDAIILRRVRRQYLGITVPVIDLAELRQTYLRFMHEHGYRGLQRWSSKHAVLTIDALLGLPPSVVAYRAGSSAESIFAQAHS